MDVWTRQHSKQRALDFDRLATKAETDDRSASVRGKVSLTKKGKRDSPAVVEIDVSSQIKYDEEMSVQRLKDEESNDEVSIITSSELKATARESRAREKAAALETDKGKTKKPSPSPPSKPKSEKSRSSSIEKVDWESMRRDIRDYCNNQKKTWAEMSRQLDVAKTTLWEFVHEKSATSKTVYKAYRAWKSRRDGSDAK